MWATLASIAPTLIPLLIIYFNVIGQFGNVNVIIATVRKKSLHTKHEWSSAGPRTGGGTHAGSVTSVVSPLTSLALLLVGSTQLEYS
ncbi:unnamed protein product [Heligmosomoides polygyrus]|uniref:G_PROTEIN_RECEP_F1_2 domain-containing protein n=1 Tax=Heligmosomoides polygyrus TaxID=6339 RepID=A0A183GSC7_HELPZ|nr:unnamed protein product [Heligmosomoides polygyrus]